MDAAAQRRLRVVSAHFQPRADAAATGSGGGLDASPTAGEYAHGNASLLQFSSPAL
jgi:hypothetical protein